MQLLIKYIDNIVFVGFGDGGSLFYKGGHYSIIEYGPAGHFFL